MMSLMWQKKSIAETFLEVIDQHANALEIEASYELGNKHTGCNNVTAFHDQVSLDSSILCVL